MLIYRMTNVRLARVMSIVRPAISLVLVSSLLVATLVAGLVTGKRRRLAEMQSGHTEVLLLSEAYQHLQSSFYPPNQLDTQAMTHGAIRGLLASLEDPHTFFLEPEQRRLESDSLQGEFCGIGVLLLAEGGLVTIADISPDSPAEQAGLRVGDTVQVVNDTRVIYLSLDEVVLLIRGPLGTAVRVQVLRNGQLLQLTAIRGRIELPSLSWQLLSDAVGYVRIDSFTGRTGEELVRALNSMAGSETSALVLDLRGNGGGAVDGATAVLGQLLGHGIAYRELNQGQLERRHPIPFNAEAIDWPLAILIDGGTASAAEIVAAALRDHRRGKLIGEATFGKGSMQGIFELGDGSSIHVTIARWLSSHGVPIEGSGVRPDLVVAAVPADGERDKVLNAAMQYLDEELQSTN